MSLDLWVFAFPTNEPINVFKFKSKEGIVTWRKYQTRVPPNRKNNLPLHCLSRLTP